ncbi:hypothetical protein TYRP_017897 [Tyrophagus putrescentiae]|nr:hypothetical protein TYRP_017897 [Tyrophagus putrescentiae]
MDGLTSDSKSKNRAGEHNVEDVLASTITGLSECMLACHKIYSYHLAAILGVIKQSTNDTPY